MSDIKLTIDGQEFYLEKTSEETYAFKIPRLLYNGNEYIALLKEKDIPKDKIWELWEVGNLTTKDYIHAIKRLTDNEIFRIGDEVTARMNDGSYYNFKIGKFYVEPYDNLMVEAGKTTYRYNIKLLEKVKPKDKRDWEIISYADKYGFLQTDQSVFYIIEQQRQIFKHDYKIHSVKRLSDGEVFTVGDTVDYGIKNEYFVGSIESFKIVGNNLMALGNPFEFYINLKDISKVKPKVPLFTTEDGVEIFDKERPIYITNDNFEEWTSNAASCTQSSFCKYFSSEQKRYEYIQLYTPTKITQKELIDNFLVMTRHSGKYDSLSTFFQAKIKP